MCAVFFFFLSVKPFEYNFFFGKLREKLLVETPRPISSFSKIFTRERGKKAKPKCLFYFFRTDILPQMHRHRD